MNKEVRHNPTRHMLPSISNLLSPPYDPMDNSNPPILNFSPPSPISTYPSTPPYSERSPHHLLIDQKIKYPSISPILSPIDSPLNSYVNVQMNSNVPPLEGDDPPQRLRLPLSPQPQQPLSPISPKLLYKATWPNLSPTPSSSSTSSSSSASFDVSPSSILPSLEHFSRSRTTSEYNIDNYRRRVTQSASSSPPPAQEQQQRHRSISTCSAPVPSTRIVFDSSGQPILKRKRGRPPTMRDATGFDGGWTFLTPTVWDVHVSEEQKERELQADYKERMISEAAAAAAAASASNEDAIVDQHMITKNDHLMNDAMSAFTNSNMDTILHMPRKKRGRKPKTHIIGNSCFVWKDLTSTRSSSKQNNASTTTTKTE